MKFHVKKICACFIFAVCITILSLSTCTYTQAAPTVSTWGETNRRETNGHNVVAIQDVNPPSSVAPATPPTFTDDQGIIYTLYHDNNTCEVSGYTQTIKSSVIIPAYIAQDDVMYQVKGIAKQAFTQCTQLRNAQFPNTLSHIADNIFYGCTNLKNLSVYPAAFTTKTTDTKAIVKIPVYTAFFSTGADVSMEVDVPVIEKAVSSKKADRIKLAVVIQRNADEGSATTKASFKKVTLHPQAINKISRSGKAIQLQVTDPQGSYYRTTIDARGLEEVASPLNLALIQKDAAGFSGTQKTDLQKALNQNQINEKQAAVLQLPAHNNLPVDFQFTVPAPSSGNLYIYYYQTSRRTFGSLSYHPFHASKKGMVTFSASAGGMYVITPKKINVMGRMPSSQFIYESDGTYYADHQGTLLYGWNRIGNAYYYFDRENGQMAANTTVDGIKLQKDGTAARKTSYIAKIQTMIKARAIVQQITNASDNKSEKIKKCFLWIFQFPYKQYRKLSPIYMQDGWEITFANDIFDRRQGCCVSESSALAFLFHECGYPTVYVCHDTEHAWVELNGRVYDPLFAEARSFDKYYNVSYTQYQLHPAGKRLI